MAATGHWVDRSREYRFPDGRTLVLPAVRRRRVGALRTLLSLPDAWGFGGLVGPGLDADAVELVLRDLRAAGFPWVRIRPNPLHADPWECGSGRAGATVVLPRRAHVLRLDRCADDLFSTRFTSSCRRAIRSAEKAGLTVEVDTTGRLVPVFHALLESSIDRWAASQHEPRALAHLRARRRDPIEKFEAWAESLNGSCRILVARRDDTPIAAMIVLQGRNAHMTRGAMDRQFVGNDRPNELLMWHAICDAVEAGCDWFHMGESGASESLSRFKAKFGAEPLDYGEIRLERLPATAVTAAARSTVKQVIGFRDA